MHAVNKRAYFLRAVCRAHLCDDDTSAMRITAVALLRARIVILLCARACVSECGGAWPAHAAAHTVAMSEQHDDGDDCLWRCPHSCTRTCARAAKSQANYMENSFHPRARAKQSATIKRIDARPPLNRAQIAAADHQRARVGGQDKKSPSSSAAVRQTDGRKNNVQFFSIPHNDDALC